ncbi:MAG: DUF3127 domain-containing protein [Sediminibacterium sp.]
MELKASVKKVLATVDRGTFKSRKVWLVVDEDLKYPQTIEVELQQDKCEMFKVTEGSTITAHLNLRGREWTSPEGKTSVFNSLVCWKWDVLVAAQQEVQTVAPSAPVAEYDPKDLPF